MNKFLRKIFSLFFLILIVSCVWTNDRNNIFDFSGSTMGTTYTIKVRKDLSEFNYDKLQSKVDSVLKEVNNQMSTWQKDSEISRFNNYKKTDWFPISHDFAYVLKQAKEVSKISGGAFDFTVGPLVNLWGFGPNSKGYEVPSEDEIEKAKSEIGYGKIAVKTNPPAVKKEMQNMYCDLSAIAKGFGVDKVAEILNSFGLNNFMIEIGGEVRTAGRNQNDSPWKIGISTPDGGFEIEKVLEVSNLSVATSGDYRNYFEKNGVRFSHTIDPRTGRPITNILASVSVVYPDCTFADAMATAIDVLGPEAGYKLAVEKKLPVLLIVREKDKFVEKMTRQFEKLISKN
jgi:thiamine biosynthesis lipoprotein